MQSPGLIIDHRQREARERRARIGESFDDFEVIKFFFLERDREFPCFLQSGSKFPRLARELRALLFRPSHRYGTADAIGVPDRAVLMLEALVSRT